MNRARDILYHFCCDAFHLKDWIYSADNQSLMMYRNTALQFPRRATRSPHQCAANVPTLPTASSMGTLLAKSSIPLAGLPKSLSTRKVPRSRRLPFTFSANHWKIRARASGDEYYALNVAKDAVDAWDAWLPSNGLPLPSNGLPLPTL